jgi:hypothetical protein
LVIDLVIEQEAHNLHDGGLDGGSVLQNGQVECEAGTGAGLGMVVVPGLVKVTELLSFKSWGTALGSVDLDVLTTSYNCWIEIIDITHITT